MTTKKEEGAVCAEDVEGGMQSKHAANQVNQATEAPQAMESAERYTRFGFGYAYKWGQAYRCSWKQFNEFLDSKFVESICDQIALISEGYWSKTEEERSAIDDKKKGYKQQLPFFAVHSQDFGDDAECAHHRCNEMSVDNGCGMLDIDHIENPREIWNQINDTQIAENGIFFASITPSGFGLRVIAERRDGETIIDCQHRLAALFGIDVTKKGSGFDNGVHDPCRISYVSPRKYVLCFDEKKICFADEEEARKVADRNYESRFPRSVVASEMTSEKGTPKMTSETGSQCINGQLTGINGGMKTAINGDKDMTFSIGGMEIPYRLIVQELMVLVAREIGDFVKNNRHNTYIELCRDLRNICDNNPEMLLELVPNKSLDDDPEDLSRVARDVCGWHSASMSERMKAAIHNAMMAMSSGAPSITVEKSSPLITINEGLIASELTDTQRNNGQLAVITGDMDTANNGGCNGDIRVEKALRSFEVLELPGLLEVLVSKLRDTEHRAAAVISTLPVIGALATGVRFMYHGNEEHSLTFQTMVVGGSGRGKSQIHKPAKTLARRLVEVSRMAERKEDDYRSQAAMNEVIKPERNAIRVLHGEITPEAFLHYQKACKGKHQLLIASEYANFVGKNVKDWGADSPILRAAFDTDEWSRMTKSVGAENGSVHVYFNILAAMVDDSVDDFFTDKSIREGNALRWSYAWIQHKRSHDDVAPYTQEEVEYIDAYAEALMQIAQEKYIECPWVNKAVAHWKTGVCAGAQDEAEQEIAERCEVIACRAGYAAAFLYDCARGKGSAKMPPQELQQKNAAFAVWVADYTYAVQCHFFLERKRRMKHSSGGYSSCRVRGYKQMNMYNNNRNIARSYGDNRSIGGYTVESDNHAPDGCNTANSVVDNREESSEKVVSVDSTIPQQQSAVYVPTKVAQLLEALPEQFSWEELKATVAAQGEKSNDNALYNRLNNYKKQGFIVQPDPSRKEYRKCTI